MIDLIPISEDRAQSLAIDLCVILNRIRKLPDHSRSAMMELMMAYMDADDQEEVASCYRAFAEILEHRPIAVQSLVNRTIFDD